MKLAPLLLASIASLALVCSLSSLPTTARAQERSTVVRSLEDGKILRTVEFDRVDVREALRKLFQAQGTSYSIAPDVQGTVTVSLTNVTLEVALRNVAAQVNATYRVEGGVYMVIPRSQLEPIVQLDRPTLLIVRLDSPGQPFESGLQRLLASGLRYIVEGGRYFLLNSEGDRIAEILPPAQGAPRPGAPTITQDANFLYILRGDRLQKVSKKDLKVVATNSIAGH